MFDSNFLAITEILLVKAVHAVWFIVAAVQVAVHWRVVPVVFQKIAVALRAKIPQPFDDFHTFYYNLFFSEPRKAWITNSYTVLFCQSLAPDMPTCEVLCLLFREVIHVRHSQHQLNFP